MYLCPLPHKKDLVNIVRDIFFLLEHHLWIRESETTQVTQLWS